MNVRAHARTFLLLLLLTATPEPARALTHMPGELNVHNAALYNYRRNNIPFSTPTYQSFLPMLTYLDNMHIPRQYMMDTFVLYDPALANHGTGMGYDRDVLRGFLDDTFVGGQAPFVTTSDHCDPTTSGTSAFLLTADVSLPAISQGPIAVAGGHPYTFAAYFRNEQLTDIVRIGFILRDADGALVTPTSSCEPVDAQYSWRSEPGYWSTEASVGGAWGRAHATIDLPLCAATLTVYVIRSSVPDVCGSRVLVDYAQLVQGTSADLLSDAQLLGANFQTLIADGSFETDIALTPWSRAGYEGRTYALFSDRLSAMDGLRAALNVARPTLGDPARIGVILMLPSPCQLDNGNRPAYEAAIKQYLDESEAAFVLWRTEHAEPRFSLIGWYYESEGAVKEDDPAAETWRLFFESLSSAVHARGGLLFTAGRYRWSAVPPPSQEGVCAYDPLFRGYFDCIWAQPNCFESATSGSSTGNAEHIDLDVLRYAGRDAIENGFGVNMERKGTTADEWSQETQWGYGRIVDYLNAGYNLGFVNFSHSFFDAGGVYWWSAYSTDIREREEYDLLNKFIQDSKRGVLPNSGFEHRNGSTMFESWVGAYDVVKRESAFHPMGHFYASCAPGNALRPGHRLTCDPSAQYRIGTALRENLDDGQSHSALISIEFFDANGQEQRSGASGLMWSNVLDAWYQYLTPTTAWSVQSIGFAPPSAGVSMRIELRNWSLISNIHWDDAYIEWNGERTGLQQGWSASGPIYLRENDEPLFLFEEIDVEGGAVLWLSVIGKESRDDDDATSALCRVDLFDSSGNSIGEGDGDPIGLTWSDELGSWYTYVDVESNVLEASSWLENRWVPWSQEVVVPATARKARVSFYRWTLDDANVISFQRPTVRLNTVTGVGDTPAASPAISLRIENSPALGRAGIQFKLPVGSVGTVEVVDVHGRIVNRLGAVRGNGDVYDRIVWHGNAERGANAASGVYFVRLVMNGKQMARGKLVFLR